VGSTLLFRFRDPDLDVTAVISNPAAYRCSVTAT
jgi:hypothetical protein